MEQSKESSYGTRAAQQLYVHLFALYISIIRKNLVSMEVVDQILDPTTVLREQLHFYARSMSNYGTCLLNWGVPTAAWKVLKDAIFTMRRTFSDDPEDLEASLLLCQKMMHRAALLVNRCPCKSSRTLFSSTTRTIVNHYEIFHSRFNPEFPTRPRNSIIIMDHNEIAGSSRNVDLDSAVILHNFAVSHLYIIYETESSEKQAALLESCLEILSLADLAQAAILHNQKDIPDESGISVLTVGIVIGDMVASLLDLYENNHDEVLQARASLYGKIQALLLLQVSLMSLRAAAAA